MRKGNQGKKKQFQTYVEIQWKYDHQNFCAVVNFHKRLLARTDNPFGSIDLPNKFHVSYQIGIALCVLLAQSMVIYCNQYAHYV